MKIGLELEAGFDRDSLRQIEAYCDKIGADWKSDGSVDCDEDENYPHEIATRVYNESEIKDIEAHFKKIYQYIGEINHTMGLHIHLSFKEENFQSALFSRRFTSYFGRELKKNFKDCPELMDRFKNRYCRNQYGKDFFKNIRILNDSSNRYKMVNFVSFGSHGTIEFRIFNAPKDYKQLTNYLVFTIAIVKKYIQTTKFNAEESLNLSELPAPIVVEDKAEIESTPLRITI